MNEPPKRAFTQQEIIEAARHWVWSNYKGMITEEKYHTYLGLLIDFVTDLVPKEEKLE